MANITQRIIKALSNTEQKAPPDHALPVKDGETVIGTLSPAAQGLFYLMDEVRIEGVVEKEAKDKTTACGKTCRCAEISSRLHYLREFMAYIVAEELGRVGKLSVDIRADWKIVESAPRTDSLFADMPELEALLRGRSGVMVFGMGGGPRRGVQEV